MMEGMMELPMGPPSANSERRRAQNRRSQAAFRARQRQRIQELERQLQWLQDFKKRWPGRLKTDQEDTSWYGGTSLVRSRHSSSDIPRVWNEWDDGQNSIRTSSLTPSSPSDTPTLKEYQLHDFAYPVSPLQRPDLLQRSISAQSAVARPKSGTVHHQVVTPNNQLEQQRQPRHGTPRLISTLDAIILNALVLGTPETDLITEGAISEFYSPLKHSEHAGLPVSLKPTAAQRAFPHPRFIDCIPLPTFRSRVIYALSAQPPLIDEWDLLHDILSGGMYCTSGNPADPNRWHMSPNFTRQWQNLLSIDYEFLEGHALVTGRSFGFPSAQA